MEKSFNIDLFLKEVRVIKIIDNPFHIQTSGVLKGIVSGSKLDVYTNDKFYGFIIGSFELLN